MDMDMTLFLSKKKWIKRGASAYSLCLTAAIASCIDVMNLDFHCTHKVTNSKTHSIVGI